MIPRQTTPIIPFAPVPPDADWETVRARIMAGLAEDVPEEWSDHNPLDPGVTLAEAAAFGLADLHYRIAERPFDAWPLEVRDWERDADRHWGAVLPVGSWTAVAAALAAPEPTSAAVLEPLIRNCASPADAAALLSKAPWSAAFPVELRPAVTALMRSRLVREAAQEQAHLVAEAVAAQRASGDPVAVRDAKAVSELAFALPLWEEELAALVRRERRRLSQEVLLDRLEEVRAVTAAGAPRLRALLCDDGLDPAEADAAMAAAPHPPGTLPEDLEDSCGHSRIWPPHPIQALTCEPVTADDYARRARAHPSVGRAWALPGRLDGIAWNGLPTGRLPSIPVDENAAAITLVVERIAGFEADDGEFLRSVLRTAIGPEASAPFTDWRTGPDSLEPRRVIGDEVGAGLLARAQVLVKGTLVTGIDADRAALVDRARSGIRAFFAAGRPESRTPAPEPVVDGPWPRHDQPGDGWIPGEPVRLTEVVEAIVADTGVWGVQDLGLKVEGDERWRTPADGRLPLPRNAVPVLAPADCLRVRFSLAAERGDA